MSQSILSWSAGKQIANIALTSKLWKITKITCRSNTQAFVLRVNCCCHSVCMPKVTHQNTPHQLTVAWPFPMLLGSVSARLLALAAQNASGGESSGLPAAEAADVEQSSQALVVLQ